MLLLDAGGENKGQTQQSFGERHWTLILPGYNWGYKTVPQQGLDGREIDYSRGKGLGGSTAINFCVYTRGPSADYDHWAELVGDASYAWEHSQTRFKNVWIHTSRCPHLMLKTSRLRPLVNLETTSRISSRVSLRRMELMGMNSHVF